MKFLFDASSLFQVIKSVSEDGALRALDENCILELTKYEVGNALWKEYVLHHTIGEDEFKEFLDLFQRVVLRTKVLVVGAEDLSDVAEVAAKEKITFYDASYIRIARTGNLTLVTEDEQLMKGASGYVRTATSKKVLA